MNVVLLVLFTTATIIGLAIGYKDRANLIYILFILPPFISMGLKINIIIFVFHVFIYLYFIPSIFLLSLDLITKKYKKDYFIIFFFIISLYLLVLIRYPFSFHPDAFDLITRFTICITVFLYVIFNSNKINPKILVILTEIMIIIQTYIAIYQYRGIGLMEIFPFIATLQKKDIVVDLYRATGSFADPNYYSLYMAILAGILIFYTDKFISKFFFFIALIGIILSFSRMGIILNIILILLYLLQRIRVKNIIVICTVLFLLIGGMYIFNFFDYYDQYPIIYNILYRFESGGNFQLNAISFYFKDILNASNLLFGLGFQNFEYALEEHTGIFQVAHNQYIQMLADLGIIGLSPLLILIFMLITKYKMKLLSKKNPFLYPFIIILFGNMFLLNTYEIYIYLFCGLYIGFIIEKLNREVKS